MILVLQKEIVFLGEKSSCLEGAHFSSQLSSCQPLFPSLVSLFLFKSPRMSVEIFLKHDLGYDVLMSHRICNLFPNKICLFPMEVRSLLLTSPFQFFQTKSTNDGATFWFGFFVLVFWGVLGGFLNATVNPLLLVLVKT